MSLQIEKITSDILSQPVFIKNIENFGQYFVNNKLVTIASEIHNITDTHCPYGITYTEYIKIYSKYNKLILIELPANNPNIRNHSINMSELISENGIDVIYTDYRVYIISENDITSLYHLIYTEKQQLITLTKQQAVGRLDGIFLNMKNRWYSDRILVEITLLINTLNRQEYTDNNFNYLQHFLREIADSLHYITSNVTILLSNIIKGIRIVDNNHQTYKNLISVSKIDKNYLKDTIKTQLIEILFWEISTSIAKIADFGIMKNILKNDNIVEIYCLVGKSHFINFDTIFKEQKLFSIGGSIHCIDVTNSLTITAPVLSPLGFSRDVVPPAKAVPSRKKSRKTRKSSRKKSRPVGGRSPKNKKSSRKK